MSENVAEHDRTLVSLDAPLLATQAARQLRDAILRGQLLPGAHLAERTVAAQLGVSTIVVREVFSDLEDRGLITRIPRRGAFVTLLSPTDLVELTQVRVVNEQLAVELAMANWDTAADKAISDVVAEMDEAARDGDAARFFILDERFHLTFHKLSGNGLLLEVAGDLRGRVSRFLMQSNAGMDRIGLEEAAGTHRAWLESVRRGRPAETRRVVKAHITGALNRLQKANGKPS